LGCLCNPKILDPEVARRFGLDQEGLCRCLGEKHQARR